MQYNLYASINEFYDLILVVHFASYQILRSFLVTYHIYWSSHERQCDAFSVDFSISKYWVFAIYLVNILSSRFVAENVTIYSKSN